MVNVNRYVDLGGRHLLTAVTDSAGFSDHSPGHGPAPCRPDLHHCPGGRSGSQDHETGGPHTWPSWSTQGCWASRGEVGRPAVGCMSRRHLPMTSLSCRRTRSGAPRGWRCMASILRLRSHLMSSPPHGRADSAPCQQRHHGDDRCRRELGERPLRPRPEPESWTRLTSGLSPIGWSTSTDASDMAGIPSRWILATSPALIGWRRSSSSEPTSPRRFARTTREVGEAA
jgi:hypothetical protein